MSNFRGCEYDDPDNVDDDPDNDVDDEYAPDEPYFSLQQSAQFQKDLEFLTNRSKLVQTIGHSNPIIAKERAVQNSKIHRYSKYIQSKLNCMRNRTRVDTNARLQKHYDAFMQELITDIECRLEKILKPEDDTLFATVYDSDDDYVLDVHNAEQERHGLKHADIINVRKLGSHK